MVLGIRSELATIDWARSFPLAGVGDFV